MTVARAIPSPQHVQDARTRMVLDALVANVEALFGTGDSAALTEARAKALGILKVNRTGAVYYDPTTTKTTAATAGVSGSGITSVRLFYDVADGQNAIVGAHDLGLTLAKNCRVVRAFYEVTEAFTSAGAATLAVGITTDDADGIVAPTAVATLTDGYYADGIQTGSAANFSELTLAPRSVYVNIATADMLTGRLALFIQYVQVE